MTVDFRHATERNVIRLTFIIPPDQRLKAGIYENVPQDNPIVIHMIETFEPHEMVVEVGTNGAQLMTVTLKGGLIVKTDAGDLVTSHPRQITYGRGCPPGHHLSDLPDWTGGPLQAALRIVAQAVNI